MVLRISRWVAVFAVIVGLVVLRSDDLGLNTSASGVLQNVLLANAAVFAIIWLSSRRRISGPILATISTLAIYGVAIFDIAIGLALFADFSVERAWMLGFVLIGAIWLASYFQLLDDSNSETNETLEETSEPTIDIKPAYPSRVSQLRGWAASTFQTVLHNGLVISGLAGGVFCFHLVRLTVFQDRLLSEDRLTDAISSLLETLGIYVGAIALVLIIVFGGIALLHTSFLRAGAVDPNQFSRPLTQPEADWIEKSLDKLLDHVEATKYPRAFSFLYPIMGLTLLMIMMGVGFAIGAAPIYLMGQLAEPESANTLSFGTGFVAPLLGMFVGICCIMPVGQFLIGFSRRFSEYAYVRGGWMTMNSTPRTADQFLIGLDRALRKGRISIAEPFDAKTYLQSAFREFAAQSYKVGGIALLSICLLGMWDANRFRRLDEDGITWSNYLDIGSHRTEWSGIAAIETGCYSTRRDGRRNLIMRYRLVTTNGHVLSLHSQINSNNLDLLERIDARMVSEGAELRPISRGDMPSHDRHCAGLLATRFEENAQRVRTLLRVEG